MSTDLGKAGSVAELSSERLARAMQIYLRHAYPDGNIPAARGHFSQLGPETPLEVWLSQKGVERWKDTPPALKAKYALRVGNAWYPHMKILIALMEPESNCVFAVDTHDRLQIPSASSEADGLRLLQEKNQSLARQIEQTWDEEGIPTQAGLLRGYLATIRSTLAPS